MFEHRSAPLLPSQAFRRRMLRHSIYALNLLLASLAVGTLGFHYLASQEPLDAFLNTSMLLGGMGPVGDIRSPSGKVFAALFALYAGLLFLAIGTIVLAPVIHRFLHTFNMEEATRRKKDS